MGAAGLLLEKISTGALAGAGRYWLHSAGGSQLAGTAFALDTGNSLTNGADVVFGDWDGTSGNRSIRVDGFVGPGHVSLVIGTEPYDFVASDGYSRPPEERRAGTRPLVELRTDADELDRWCRVAGSLPVR